MGGIPQLASFGQERLWFLHQVIPESPVYHVVIAIRLKGPLDIPLAEQCINQLIARHESLRTTFAYEDGRLLQIVAPQLRIELARGPWRDSLRPFDPARGPLIRANLEQVTVDENLLAFTIHHLVTDGWSSQILLREFCALYTAAAAKVAELAPIPIRYADFAVWQREQAEAAGAHRAYWKKQLSEPIARLNLATDRPRGPAQTFAGARESAVFTAALGEELKAFSRRERASLFMTLLTAFKVLLWRYTGQEDILVGSPIAGRTRTDAERLVGFLVNTLVLRANLAGEPPFREALARVRRVALEAYAHQDVPFEHLVAALETRRENNRTPFFDVMFQLRNVPKQELTIPGLQVTRTPLHTGTAKFELTMELTETPSGLDCSIEYNSDLFDAATIQRMIGHYQRLLESVVANPDCRISKLPFLSAAEQSQLLLEWNDTARDYPAECIQTLFEQQAARSPDAIAVCYDQRRLTYRELNARANHVARRLRGLACGELVGISMQRSPEMVVGILGILKAGAAYVPLDPAYPRDRLEFMRADSGVKVVLTDENRDLFAGEIDENPTCETNANSVAYVIYTSGSTGKPKGVAVPHRGVNRLVRNTNYIDLSADHVVAQVSNCSFDAATFEIWGALLNGARLEGIGQEVILSPQVFANAIRAKGITAIFVTTALFNQMARSCPAAFQSLGTVLFGGEASNPACVAEILAQGAPLRLVHVYGPTETTTFATWRHVTAVTPEQQTIPIGRPVANTSLYVLDQQLNPVPVGIAGELYIGGPGVALGYVNRDELTAHRFVTHSFVPNRSERLYRTGDKVRYLPDGDLEFLGRFDDQVKIRGWRIEPGEIERTLADHPGVLQAAVLVREDTPGDKRLAAYVVPRTDRSLSSEELRSFLRERMPEYMVPSALILMDALPMTAFGKLDRGALPRPNARLEVKEYLGPRDPLQYQLTRIWEELLGVHPIGVRDSFFDLGGHSLLAVKMVDEIAKACGKHLPLTAIFAAPTIERIADTLLRQEENAPWVPLIEVQPGKPGTKLPFFFLHGDFVTGGFYCMDLARALGADQPFYALQPHGLDGREVPPTIEEMAHDHLQTLRAFQPNGPYILGGHCNGGVIAFEMARRLRAENQEVALLALVHSWAGRAYTGFDKEWEVDPWSPKPEELNSPDYYLRRGQAYHRYTRAIWTFSPQRYPGEVTLFWPREEQFRSGDETAGWGKVAAGVNMQPIAGDHLTSITAHVQDLALRLRACLERNPGG